MTNKSFLRLTIILLIIFNIILGMAFLLNNQKKDKLTKTLNNKILENRLNHENINHSILFHYLLESNFQKTKYWKNYPEIEKSYFIVLFNRGQCMSCVKKIIIDFSFLKQKTGFDRFALMGAFNDSLSFFQTADSLDGEFRHIYLFPFDKELLNYPYPVVFEIGVNKNINYFFVPELFPELRKLYFYTFLKKLCERYI